MFGRSRLIVTLAVAGVGAVSAQAAGAPEIDADGRPQAKLELLDKPEQRLERSIEVHRDRLERERERRQARRNARQPDVAPPEQYGVSQATLESIASCESGGDPTAVSSDGTYRGKYQFDTGTWAAVGGSGDPAAAPEAEQDMRAAMLYSQSGSSPWPICG
jgi:soluble lytic murein transglycosylase-like protein